MTQPEEVIIIGAGISGLCCALELHKGGIPFRILEASDGPGGRVRTDTVEGFRLDRGFQVLLTAYPEARRVLDYPELDLKPFFAGCYIHRKGRFIRFGDPFRSPSEAWKALTASVGTLADRWRIFRLRSMLKGKDTNTLGRELDSIQTVEDLRSRGFSKDMVNSFFKPFFGGVFLEPELATSRTFFHFAFKMFSEGNVALPAKGIGAIADQLAAKLPSESIYYQTRVNGVHPGGYTLASGERHDARFIVIATDGGSSAHLLQREPLPHNTVSNLYFAAEHSPVKEKPAGIVLFPECEWINSLSVISDIASDCAPEGKTLISVSIVRETSATNAALEKIVREELQSVFGDEVGSWTLLRTYHIETGLPRMAADTAGSFKQAAKEKNVILCGDYLGVPSLQETMRRGREAAEKVMKMTAS